MIGELRRDERIRDRYQFWVFQYPTGVSYLQSAADLRDKLRETTRRLDPNRDDKALHGMVLVGHSMGGILAKFQVTHSDNALWNAVSRQPFSEFKADGKSLTEIRRAMFFEPLPFVRRVVFIATPHRGSQWTERPLGRLGRWIVEFQKQAQQDFAQLLAVNGEVLVDKPSRIPTSIDHLAPDSPILKATASLRFRDGMVKHSIIATGRRLPDGTPGDGVVSIASASLSGSATSVRVAATHTTVNRDDSTIQTVTEILLRNGAESIATN